MPMRRADPHLVVRNVGLRIAELRRSMSLTQEELAQRLGIGVKYIQKIERGVVNLTLHTLVRWANWLGVEPAELLWPPTSAPARRGRPRRR